MDNVKFIEIQDTITGDVKEYALIDRGNEEFTSMPKSTYDEMIAKQELK